MTPASAAEAAGMNSEAAEAAEATAAETVPRALLVADLCAGESTDSGGRARADAADLAAGEWDPEESRKTRLIEVWDRDPSKPG